MRRSLTTLLSLALLTAGASAALADGEGAFVGVNLGVAEPTNSNFRAHVHTGGIASPYVGYMFLPNVGVQGELHFVGWPSDIDDRGFDGESDPTFVLGGTVGPRLGIPVWDIPSIPFLRGMEVYTTIQGGAVTGLDGRISHTGAMLSIGGGLDFYLTDHFAVGGYARWMRMFTAPRPTYLPDTPDVTQSPGEQGPKDAEFAAVGISMKYDFREPPAKPIPACPACVCPECPGARKILLRNINFDFDKTTIRADAKPVLDETIEILKREDGPFTLVIEGHTDNVGTEQYNQRLSERRVGAVKQYLTDHGVPPSRIRAIGYGEKDPVADNSTPQGRAANRRVEQRIDNP